MSREGQVRANKLIDLQRSVVSRRFLRAGLCIYRFPPNGLVIQILREQIFSGARGSGRMNGSSNRFVCAVRPELKKGTLYYSKWPDLKT